IQRGWGRVVMLSSENGTIRGPAVQSSRLLGIQSGTQRDRGGHAGMRDHERHRQVGQRHAGLVRERDELLDNIEAPLVAQVGVVGPSTRVGPTSPEVALYDRLAGRSADGATARAGASGLGKNIGSVYGRPAALASSATAATVRSISASVL